ncbi:MAG TPA: hypothetical protein VK675_01330 [Candidatus Paceibacterota bacterium]|nr:hypothetical protein [Candidatus Paceibacterota bacterium]
MSIFGLIKNVDIINLEYIKIITVNFDKLNTNKAEKQSGAKKWLKKNAAIAGVVGLGYLGSMGNSQAQEQQASPEGNKAKITNVEAVKVGKENINTNETQLVKFVVDGKKELKKVLLDSSGNTELYKGFINEAGKFYAEAVTIEGVDAHALATQAKEFKKNLEIFSEHIRPNLSRLSEQVKNFESNIAKDDRKRGGTIQDQQIQEVLEGNRLVYEINLRNNKKSLESWLNKAQELSVKMDNLIKLDSKK